MVISGVVPIDERVAESPTVKGMLTTETQADGIDAVIEVDDTGVGIAKQNL